MQQRITVNPIGDGNVKVPMARFNQGEADKIFEEVRATGCKVVMMGDKPTCVLLSPEKYREIMDWIDDRYLLELAEERIKNDTGVTYTAEEVYRELGMLDDDDDDIPMEYGVDFA